MGYKSIAVLATLLAAAFTYAPIRTTGQNPDKVGMTDAQRLAQQQFCGSVAVVGQVPEKIIEGVRSDRSENLVPEESAKLAVQDGTKRADKIGASFEADLNGSTAASFEAASDRLEQAPQSKAKIPLIATGLFIFGYAIVFFFRRWADKSIPVPKKYRKLPVKQ